MPFREIQNLVKKVFADNLALSNQKRAIKYWNKVKSNPEEHWEAAEQVIFQELREILRQSEKESLWIMVQ